MFGNESLSHDPSAKRKVFGISAPNLLCQRVCHCLSSFCKELGKGRSLSQKSKDCLASLILSMFKLSLRVIMEGIRNNNLLEDHGH